MTFPCPSPYIHEAASTDFPKLPSCRWKCLLFITRFYRRHGLGVYGPRDGDTLWTTASGLCIPMNLSLDVLISRGRPAGGAASQPLAGALAARTLPSAGTQAPPPPLHPRPRPASWRLMVSSQHEPRRLFLPFLPSSRLG